MMRGGRGIATETVGDSMVPVARWWTGIVAGVEEDVTDISVLLAEDIEDVNEEKVAGVLEGGIGEMSVDVAAWKVDGVVVGEVVVEVVIDAHSFAVVVVVWGNRISQMTLFKAEQVSSCHDPAGLHVSQAEMHWNPLMFGFPGLQWVYSTSPQLGTPGSVYQWWLSFLLSS
jgi:hypothetical protein